MGKNKNNCWVCGQKHYPPTGKNCKNAQKEEATSSAVAASGVDERDSCPERTVYSKKRQSRGRRTLMLNVCRTAVLEATVTATSKKLWMRGRVRVYKDRP